MAKIIEKVDKRKVVSDKYSDKFPDLIRKYVIEWGLVNQRQQPAWAKISDMLGVSYTTVQRWRDPQSELYKPEFDLACKDAEEACELDLIKRSAKQKAEGYTRKKLYKELHIEGPMVPSNLASFSKKAMERWAKKYLDMDLNSILTSHEMRFEIEAEVRKRSTETLKVVREERENVPGDVSAIKLVASNVGPKDKRWYEKQEHEISVNKETATLLGMIDGSSKGLLPRDETESEKTG